jgi:hypothetical protein
LYASANVIRKTKKEMRRMGNITCMEKTCAYKVLVGKCEGKEPLGRPGRRKNNNIKRDI